MITRTRTSENGAVAVLVALLAIVLFSVGAVAVDMGNVYYKRRDLQTNVDLAVLAAAEKLPDRVAAAQVAEDYLNSEVVPDNDPVGTNEVYGQVGPIDLSTSGDRDGYLEFDYNGDPWSLRLHAPQVEVDFGMAKIMGFDSVDVPARAAVSILSPGTGVMPAFAVNGCDYGPQTLLDPTGGGPTTLDLYNDSPPYNAAELTSPLTPESVALNTTGQSLVISGGSMGDITEVAFSLDGRTPADGGHVTTPISPATPAGATSVTVAEIPSDVTDTEGAWYVRVKRSDGRWSDPDEAPTLLVGSAFLECDSGPTDGNFGTLLLPRSDGGGTDEQLAKNMVHGLEYGLVPYDGAASPWTCYSGDGTAVLAPDDKTNCVDTDTGFARNGATMGLITGVDGEPGRLDAIATSNRCATGPFPRSDWEYDPPGGGTTYNINDDTLTCYFTNDTTTIGEIGEGYTGPGVLSEDIFESPRFFWVPVLGANPDSGGSNKYQIVEFRPGFITDQPTSATRINPQVGAGGTHNGIVAGSAGIEQLKVVFFSPQAFPETIGEVDGTMPYIGVGPKILRLVE